MAVFPAAAPATAGPPNILLLMLDSLDGRLLDPESSVYGEVELPHLRAFASTAVNFVRAYSANPVCVPSRTAMLTGRLPHLLHVFSNSDGLAASNGSSILDARCVRERRLGERAVHPVMQMQRRRAVRAVEWSQECRCRCGT